MKNRIRKAAAFVACISMAMLLSGCSGGVLDSIDLVKQAEHAKQTLEQLEQNKNVSKSVGTVSSPSGLYSITANDFDAEHNPSDGTIEITWDIEALDSVESIDIEVLVDYDNSGVNGQHLYTIQNVEPNGTDRFSVQSVSSVLDPDTEYYFYMCASGAEGDMRSIDYCYDMTPLYFSEADLEQLPSVTDETEDEDIEAADTSFLAETYVPNVQATLTAGTVKVTWDPVEGASKYRVMVFPVNGAEKPLGESIATETEASVSIASDMTECVVAVATYENKTIGPYDCIVVPADME